MNMYDITINVNSLPVSDLSLTAASSSGAVWEPTSLVGLSWRLHLEFLKSQGIGANEKRSLPCTQVELLSLHGTRWTTVHSFRLASSWEMLSFFLDTASYPVLTTSNMHKPVLYCTSIATTTFVSTFRQTELPAWAGLLPDFFQPATLNVKRITKCIVDPERWRVNSISSWAFSRLHAD